MSSSLPPAGAPGSVRGNEALIDIIRQEIAAAGGRITFARYMDLALYHPQHGYYCQSTRDYQTAPEVHPLFGALIGHQMQQMWELLGRPSPFHVVEMGAGRGHLLRAVVGHFRRQAPGIDLRYMAIDVGPRPAGMPEEVEWSNRPLEQWPSNGLAGCILSNELVDAFPVHRVVMRDGELREVYVEDASAPSVPPLPLGEGRGESGISGGPGRTSPPCPLSALPRKDGEGETGTIGPAPSPWKVSDPAARRADGREGRGEGGIIRPAGSREERTDAASPRSPSPSFRGRTERGLGRPKAGGEVPFRDVLGPPSTPELAAYFAWLGIALPEGHYAEVNLRARRWMGEVARVLDRGFVLTIDYGYPAEEMYARPQGTLLCYHGQEFNPDPYRWVGEQDITAHADFSALADAGREAGLHFTGLLQQASFLRNLGLGAYERSLDLGVASGRISAARRYDARSSLRELTDRQAMGGFRVLLQHKGLVEPALDGLDPTNRRKRDLWSHPPEWPW